MGIRIVLVFLMVATLLVIPSSVSAVAPPTTIQIDQVDVYQGVIDSTDQLYIITYDIQYSGSQPTQNSEELFLIRLMDAVDQQLGVTVPVAYNNNGFDNGVAGIYFTAGDVDTLSLSFGPGNGYYMQIVGNPMISWDTGTPPFENKLTFANYYNSDIQDTLHTRLSVITNIIQNEWNFNSTPLIEGPSGEQTLTAIGEEYMTAAILNLRTLNPQLFQAATSRPEYTDTEIISDYYVGGDTVSSIGQGNRWLAQTFVASTDYELDTVSIKANFTGSASDVTVSIYNSSGSPTGAALSSGTISASNFQVAPALDWEDAAIPEVSLDSGSEYAIVVSSSGTLNWRYDNTSTYNGNALVSTNAGASWSGIADSTFMFATKAKGAKSLAYLRRLEHQLDGTVFDSSSSEVYLGMSSMWVRTILWMIIAILFAAYIGYETNNPKPITPIFFWITCSGYFISMVDPFVALGFAVLGGFAAIYMTLFNRAPT